MPLRVIYELTWPEGTTYGDAVDEVRVFALPSGTWQPARAIGDMLALRAASDLIADAVNLDLAPEPEQ
jgi:hypothetical protein